MPKNLIEVFGSQLFSSGSVESSGSFTANIFQAWVFTEVPPAFQLLQLLNSACMETMTEFALHSSRADPDVLVTGFSSSKSGVDNFCLSCVPTAFSPLLLLW